MLRIFLVERKGGRMNFKKFIWKGLVLSTAVWATACSEVSFTPGQDISSLGLQPDGSQKESFTFDDDNTAAKVDVLFVVDNSPSMLQEHSSTRPFNTMVGMRVLSVR